MVILSGHIDPQSSVDIPKRIEANRTNAIKEDHKPHITPFTILIDNREKAPYAFTNMQANADRLYRPLQVLTRKSHLATGDYTIEGMEDLVCVERKSLSDLYSTLGQHRERFEREHDRMSQMAFACVVIEADWGTIINRPPSRSRLPPKCVFRTGLSWPHRYGVPWYTMSDRRLAEIATYRILESFYKHNKPI